VVVIAYLKDGSRLPIDLKAVQPAMVCGGRYEPSHINQEALDRYLFTHNLYPELESCLNGEDSECDVGSRRDSVLVERLP